MEQQRRYFTQLAGEYLTAGELFKRGFFASVSFGYAKSFDIVVFGPKDKSARIEVKASRLEYFTRKHPPIYENDHKWLFNIRAIEKEVNEWGGLNSIKAPSDKFYVLVTLCGDRPNYYVFESRHIYNALRSKIEKSKSKGRKPSGQWDLRLSHLFKNKQDELRYLEKENWNVLKRYLEQKC